MKINLKVNIINMISEFMAYIKLKFIITKGGRKEVNCYKVSIYA